MYLLGFIKYGECVYLIANEFIVEWLCYFQNEPKGLTCLFIKKNTK